MSNSIVGYVSKKACRHSISVAVSIVAEAVADFASTIRYMISTNQENTGRLGSGGLHSACLLDVFKKGGKGALVDSEIYRKCVVIIESSQ